MAFQLRRGTDLNRLNITPANGELLYTTDTKKLYIGDDQTVGGNKVSPETTADIAEDSNYRFYTTERAQDDAAILFTTSTTVATTHTGITFAYNDASGKIVATVPDKGTVISGLAGEIATYDTTGTVISGTTGLVWDNNLRQMTLSNSGLNITASTGNRSVITMETNAPGSIGNSVSFTRSRGTNASPTPIQTLDTIGSIVFNAYDGASYITGASIFAYNPTGFPISTGVMPTAVNLNLTDGSGINATRFRVFPDGKTILGPFSPTEVGTGALNIYSTVTSSGHISSALNLRTFFDGAPGQRFSIARARGTNANFTPAQTSDEIFGFDFRAWDGFGNRLGASIVALVDGTVSNNKVPGRLELSTTNGNGITTMWTRLDKNGLLSHTGGFKRAGVEYVNPNWATISTSSTVDLSTTTSENLLLIGNSGLTVTLNMPATPADGQVCEFIVHSNNTTLGLGTGTVVPSFAGAVTFGTAFKYVYRTSNTTWYKLG